MKRKRVVRRKPVIRTRRRKSNPRARKVYRVAGESLYRQRPVYYTRDARSKKLGKRTPRKKLNPLKGVYVMKRRKRRSSRRRVRRNPIGSMFKAKRRRRVRRNPASGFLDILLQGLVTSGSMVGGLYVGKMIADMVAGQSLPQGQTSADWEKKKSQTRNLSRAALTLLGAFLLPKFTPKFADGIVSGLMAATTLGFMNTAFGINLGSLAGEDYTPGLLLGTSSFNLNDRLQVGYQGGELFGVTDLAGVNDLSGVADF